MRSLRLARIAAEAESVRLRYSARRAAVRAVLGLVALGFLFGALVFCQIAAWYWLRASWDRPAAALILAGGELVLAAILALLAARSSPGRVELEALAVRRRALEGATSGLAFSTLVTQLLRLAIDLLRRRRT
ncbi:MAG TPA: phage holin family protein [Acetobacteraceae bacterium]|nr:phage holin family protein [Acetobacteraceae bacterium]